jgi:hypothetical protein
MNMMYKVISSVLRKILPIGLVVLLWPLLVASVPRVATAQPAESTTVMRTDAGVAVPDAPVAEGRDFATHVLGDPWDMEEYADVSQYMNNGGQLDLMRNIQTSDGVFSAQSVDRGDGGGDPYIFPLFPGYLTAMHIGRVGARYPVDSTEYGCFYTAMLVESRAARDRDVWSVFWFEDEHLNDGTSRWGFGVDFLHDQDAAPVWQLYRMELANPPIVPDGFDVWDASNVWRGLRIDPTSQGGVNFAIDWVRLTDCAPRPVTVRWTPDAAITAIWLQPIGTNRYIRVATEISGGRGTHELDVQGLQAGSYRVGLGTDTDCCISESPDLLEINAAPTVSFFQPSFVSGQDYATSAGNEWDFQDGADVTELRNGTGGVGNGTLEITTPSGPMPAGTDVQVDLNTPQPAPTDRYRYVSFRMFTDWDADWQDAVGGMIVRLIWTIPSLSGQPGMECHLVSQDIPVDVGWHTYHIDMYDAFQGAAEDSAPAGAPHCPDREHSPEDPPDNVAANPAHWLFTSPIIRFRFDPNENISCELRQQPDKEHIPCSDYRQRIDWITMTAVDRVIQGQAYEIILSLSEQLAADSFKFYYTSDRNQPRQNELRVRTQGAAQPPAGDHLLYLPITLSPGVASGAQAQDPVRPAIPHAVQWDTAGVAPGEYYICVDAQDDLNTTTFCSETPVQVVRS